MSFYELLEVNKQSTPEEIKKAYRKMAMKYHPDRNAGDEKAADMFKKIQAAYETLSDTVKKISYDTGLVSPKPPHTKYEPAKPAPVKKPVRRKDPEDMSSQEIHELNRQQGFTYSDAPEPARDVWGMPIKGNVKKEPVFKDIFAKHYDGSIPDLR